MITGVFELYFVLSYILKREFYNQIINLKFMNSEKKRIRLSFVYFLPTCLEHFSQHRKSNKCQAVF